MQNKQSTSIRTVVATGIGAAVIFVLMKFVAIPTGVPNTQFNVAMGFLALLGAIFGPVAAGLAVFIGHALNDFVTYGSPWWTWVIVDGLIGVAFGLAKNRLKIDQGVLSKAKLIWFNLYQIVINFIGWVILAPTGDIIIYHEPASKVYVQGITTWIVDSISVAVIGTILLVLYARTRTQHGSLKKER
ncbi:ECF-type riboflavin transporter substrate-binding protein [Lactobacillus sp. CBA3605]|uniref:ECF-type riboflavin transporter substrate-binding protein n=1 Tax=Lactobacillus sp. CBA3605 TaxID=2099788 RepID=UPI000CFB3FE2|nr:ECF-type riboflavin transporter substrate-binding protein [Lactobacillus sp. CBA3605]AVK61624.1 ECF-type riboflavin transporter substrate-binding protein [Lactobacillus sp. CBA3605]